VVSDEPTNGELARRLDDIYRTLQGSIGQPQYVADQRRIDDRLEDLRRGDAEERRDREAAVRAVHQRITDELASAANNKLSWRTILYTGVIPALIVLLSILVQIWLHGGTK
jgi:hypothetical protein